MSTATFDDEENVISGDRTWDMGTSATSRAFGGESWSYEYIAHQNQNVHLLQKIKPISDRPRIPATLPERLAFFRLYFNSYGKVFLAIDLFDFNRLIWDYFINVFFKLLPTSYIYYFLASYVPEEHLYISKMVPFFAGYNLLVFIAALILLFCQAYYVILLFYYIVVGFVFQSPWKACNHHVTNSVSEHFAFNITCIDIPSLRKLKAESVFVKRSDSVFMAKSNNNVTSYYVPAPHLYLLHTSFKILYRKWCLIGLFIVAGLFYKQIYKKYVWKIMYNFQWVIQIIYACTLIHLLLFSLETKIEEVVDDQDITDVVIMIYDYDYYFTKVYIQDSGMFQEMNHAPPLIHFITSRTTDQVNPGSDTALLILSNTMFFFLKVLTQHKIIRYCEHVSGLYLKQYSGKHVFAFIFWPLYLSMVPFGNIIMLVVYIASFVTEFLTFIICYQTLVEVVMSKWKNVRKWISLIFLTIAMIAILPVLDNFKPLSIAFILWASAFIEISTIIFFYPVPRLMDDIIFHFGIPSSKITEFIIKMVPFLYLILFYRYYSNVVEYCNNIKSKLCENPYSPKDLIAGLIIVVVSMTTGAVYVIIRVILFKRENWRALFRPVPDWGPLDHIQRQLRKYYDSREYISSRASRYLSRYLMTRASEQSYQLDLLYDRQGARSTMLLDSVRIDNERRKEKVD